LKGCDVILAVKERAEGRLRQRYELEPLELSEDEGERMFSAGDPCSSSGGLTERERQDDEPSHRRVTSTSVRIGFFGFC
jgi:hypothetical protein